MQFLIKYDFLIRIFKFICSVFKEMDNEDRIMKNLQYSKFSKLHTVVPLKIP